MAKTKISEFSSTPANNTDIDSINIAEGCAPSGINDAIRELMAQLKDFQTGAQGDSFNGPIGTSTAAAGAFTTLSASSTVTLSGGTANGVPYLNGSKVLTSGSALSFSGQQFAISSLGDQIKISNSAGNQQLTLSSNAGGSVFSSHDGTNFVNMVWQSNTTPLMTLTTTGLGIATTTPAYKLDVVGTAGISGNLTLSGGTANGVAYLNGSKVVTSGSALTFDGTTLTATTQMATGTTGTAGKYLLNRASDGAAAVSLGLSSNDFSANNGAGGGYIFNISSTEQMRLTSTGLGIGTSSPAVKLHTYTASGTNGFRMQTGGTSSGETNRISFVNATGASDVRSGVIEWFEGGTFLGDLRFLKAGGLEIRNSSDSATLNLNNSGNLGLGVTPSAWGTYKAYQVGWGSLASYAGADTAVFSNAYFDGGSWRYIGTGTASQYRQLSGAHSWHTAPSGTAGNAITFTQAMTLDASGNLGVGTTSPAYKLDVFGTTPAIRLKANGVGTGVKLEQSSATGDVELNVIDGYPLLFKTSNTERARIDSSGNLLVGTTSSSGLITAIQSSTSAYAGYFTSNYTASGDGNIMFWGRAGGAASAAVRYKDSTTSMEFYSPTGQTVAYTTSSDYRLKNSIAPMTGALAKVAALKPVTYKWNVDGSDGEGFIAHELAEVVPQCVTGEKDAVDEEGNPKYQGIDTSFLVATLTAAIQELKAEFDAYKASHP